MKFSVSLTSLLFSLIFWFSYCWHNNFSMVAFKKFQANNKYWIFAQQQSKQSECFRKINFINTFSQDNNFRVAALCEHVVF